MSGLASIASAIPRPLGFRNLGKLAVGRLLFLDVVGQDIGTVGTAKLLGPGDQGAVTGYLVVLDRLRGCDQGGVENVLVVDVAADFIGFLENAVDSRTVDRLGLHAMQFEHLLDPLDMAFGLAEVLLQAGFQLRIGSLVDHLRQRLLDLFFGVIDVAKRVDEEVVQRLDVFRKETHGFAFPLF